MSTEQETIVAVTQVDRTRSNYLRYCLGLALLLLAVAFSCRMFGHYLFDDSYFGFSYAKNLANGYGFVFNPGERYLGTSAPLVVPIYAFFYKFLGIPIQTTAQFGSFFLLTLGTLSLYALLSEEGSKSSSFSAFVASFAFMTTPLITMVITHESLLYVGFGLISVFALSKKKYALSGLLIGLAALCRMEASMLGISTIALLLLKREKTGILRYISVAALTVAPWAVFATCYFGSPLSNTVNAKHLQVLFGNSTFLPGIVSWIKNIYPKSWLLLGLGIIIGSSLASFRRINPWIALLATWALLQSLLYIVMDVAFYHWFIVQFGVLLALAVFGACQTVTKLKGAFKLPQLLITIAAVLSLLTWQVQGILSNHNREETVPYYRLAQWLRVNTKPTDKIAYLEIGMLKFFSDRFIVDWLGLTTPGVIPRIANGDCSWVIKQYKPEIFVQNDLFNWFLDIESYPWFKQAYRPKAVVDVGYPVPFKIYELVHPERIGRKEKVCYAVHRPECPIGEITAAAPVIQSIPVNLKQISSVEVRFATYGRTLKSHYRLEILQGDRCLHSEPFDAALVKDNVYRVFPMDLQIPSPDRPLALRISSIDACAGNALTIWRGGTKRNSGRLSMAGTPASGELCFRVYTAENE